MRGRVLLDVGPVERAGPGPGAPRRRAECRRQRPLPRFGGPVPSHRPGCSLAGIGPGSGSSIQGRIGVRKQALGFLVRVGDRSLPELGGQGGKHILRAGGQPGGCMLGELPEQADRRLLAGVVAGEQGEDDDLLIALGAEACGDVLDGAGQRGLRNAGERVAGVRTQQSSSSRASR